MRALLLLVALVGCGAPAVPGPTSPSAFTAPADEGPSVRARTIVRPAGLRVAVFVPAGSLHTDPPQAAAAVALALEAAHSVEARALPDHLEVARHCRELDRCLDDLRRALEWRPGEGDAASLRVALARRRRRVASPARTADGLALEALFGRSMDPLGRPEDDARLDDEALARAAARVLGSAPLQVVAVGRVEDAAVQRAAQARLGDLSLTRVTAPRLVPADPPLRVAIGNEDRWTLAAAAPSLGHGLAWARAMGNRQGAEVFPMLGQAIVLVRGRDEGAAVREAVLRLRRVAELTRPAPLPPPDSLAELARRARAPTGPNGALRVGLGALIRGDRDRAEDPTAAAGAEALFGEALAAPADPLDGLRVEVETLETEDFALVLEIESPAPGGRNHGLRSLAATGIRDACPRLAERELGIGLDGLGLDLDAEVLPRALRFTFRGPAEAFEEAAYLAARCPRQAPPDAEAWRAATLATLAQPEALWGAALALWISPSAPGRVDPRGHPESVRRLRSSQLPPLRRGWGRRRFAVGVIGPFEEGAARRALELFAAWPPGRRVAPEGWSAWRATDLDVEGSRDGRRVLAIGVRGRGHAETGAILQQALPEWLRILRRSRPAWRPLAARAGHALGEVWMAVALEVGDDDLDDGRAIATDSLRRLWQAMDRPGGAASSADLGVAAAALLRPLHEAPELGDRGEVRALLQAPPRLRVYAPVPAR
jgi:hypothetical protein